MDSRDTRYASADLFCGIDGGGTTTKVVVCNPNGEILSSFITGTINHYGAGIAKVRENFQAIAVYLEERFGGLPGHIFIGNSALSDKISQDTIKELTAGAFDGANIQFHSDVFVALIGFTLGKPGAVLVSGTGSMACGIDAGGVYQTIGGWGQVLGDEGSGYHIGQEGMKAALRAYDGTSGETQLTERLISHFRLGEISDIIQKVYYPPAEKSVIAAFATEVELAAVEGDRVAINILKQEAEMLCTLALAICLRCETSILGFYGSVLNHNATVLTHLRSCLTEKGITLSRPVFSPEIGALLAAFNEAGVPVTETIMSNLSEYKSDM